MSFIESAMCSRNEFEVKKNSRLEVSTLEINELYTVMCALKTLLAAKIPGRVVNLSEENSGLLVVGLSLFDKDLKECVKTEAVFDDSLMQTSKPRFVITSGKKSHRVETAYFMPFGDMVPDDPGAISAFACDSGSYQADYRELVAA